MEVSSKKLSELQAKFLENLGKNWEKFWFNVENV